MISYLDVRRLGGHVNQWWRIGKKNKSYVFLVKFSASASWARFCATCIVGIPFFICCITQEISSTRVHVSVSCFACSDFSGSINQERPIITTYMPDVPPFFNVCQVSPCRTSRTSCPPWFLQDSCIIVHHSLNIFLYGPILSEGTVSFFLHRIQLETSCGRNFVGKFYTLQMSVSPNRHPTRTYTRRRSTVFKFNESGH